MGAFRTFRICMTFVGSSFVFGKLNSAEAKFGNHTDQGVADCEGLSSSVVPVVPAHARAGCRNHC